MGLSGSLTEAERLKPVRSPLFAFLCGFVVSLLLGHSWGWIIWGVGSVIAATICIAGWFWRPKGLFGSRVFKSVIFVGAGLVLGWPWLQTRSEGVPEDWYWLPARELKLEIEVERLFQVRRDQRAGGIGHIVEAPQVASELTGRRVSFYLEDSVSETEWVPTTRFLAQGIVTYLPATSRDSGFDRYLLNQDVHLSLRRGSVIAVTAEGAPWSLMLMELRTGSRNLLMQADTLGYGPVFAAMLLGERALLEPELEQKFVESGSLHLFAISGLHVMAVAGFVAQALSLLRVPSMPKGVIGLSLVLLYVLMTGYSPSAVRAFAMVFCYWVAVMVQRQPNAFAAWVNSALLVLILDPRQLWLPGFQLSYGVVGGLITVAGLMQDRWLRVDEEPDWRPSSTRRRFALKARRSLDFIKRLFCLSLCASLFSAPLIVSYFELFAAGAVFLNMVLVPLAGFVVATGCISLGGGWLFGDSWSAFYNQAAWALLMTMEFIISVVLRFDGYFHTRVWPWNPTGPLLTFCALLLAATSREWARRGVIRPAFAIAAPLILIFGGILLGSVSA